jgi:acyl-CoA reductase-like NAD-dependent aldehyde dehydrogenase
MLETKARVAVEQRSPLIGGRWVEGEAGTAGDINPFTRQPFTEVGQASARQVEGAIVNADEAYRDYRAIPAHRRADWLYRASDLIRDRRDEFARMIALEVGKPLKTARVEVDRAVYTFRLAAEEAPRLLGESIPMDAVPNGEGYVGFSIRQPRGVLAAITPFNFPLNLLAHKVAPALASGNTVVSKPAGHCPITALMLGQLILDAGFAPGVFNVVPCSSREAAPLISDERVRHISFTGSVPVGTDIRNRAGLKFVILELGSNAANIVAPSANLAEAAAATVSGAFAYSGQVCISVQNLYLHESIRDEFLERYLSGVAELRLGDPLDEATDIGPMITVEDGQRALQWIEEAADQGAKILTGGRIEGNFLLPTVIADPDPGLRCVNDEIFAPVVNIHRYERLDDCIELINESRYGLNGAIFTNDLREMFYAVEHFDVGSLIVNQSSVYRADHMPYGGIKESGMGREGLRYAMEEMTEIKFTAINLGKDLAASLPSAPAS